MTPPVVAGSLPTSRAVAEIRRADAVRAEAPDRALADRAMRRWVVAAAVAGTIGIAAGAFWLSFTTLADLAARSGIAAGLSWVWPLIVDGLIVVATISVVALSSHDRAAARYPWLLLFGGAGVSVAANVTHALVAVELEVPKLVAALVACVPPVVLLAVTHLTVVLVGHGGPRGQQESLVAPGLSPGSASSRRPRAPRPRSTRGRSQQAMGLRDAGMSNREIATRLGVHPSTVGRWLQGPSQASAEQEHGGAEEQPAVLDRADQE